MRLRAGYHLTYTVLCVFTILLMWSVTQHANRQICTIGNGTNMASDRGTGSEELQFSDTAHTDMLQRALVAGKKKASSGFLTLGIPTVKRPKEFSYLISTIEDLLKNANEQEKKEITLVIFLADFDKAARDEIKSNLVKNFNSLIESGVIQVIEAPREFYPSLDSLPQTRGQSAARVRWRSKQNYDYAFLMLYAKDLSEFYLQLEDDLSTIPNYIGVIRAFINQYHRKEWTCLEFSALGFIAKLYRSQHLSKLAKMMMLFFQEQPNDFTYLMYNQMMLQKHRIVRKPTIFKHLGLHSSLPEKLEEREDPLLIQNVDNATTDTFIKTILNPPARVATNLEIYEGHKLEHCYQKQGVLWTLGPTKGKWIVVVFHQPQRILNVTVESGPDDNPDDFLQQGVLQIGQNTQVVSGLHTQCTGIFALQRFQNGQVSLELDKESQTTEAACVQIHVLSKQKNWLMISDISIRAITS